MSTLKKKKNFLSLLFSLPNVGLTSQGLTTQTPVGEIPVGGTQTLGQNTREIHKGGPP